jgi:predicted small lipoprotein YifL
MNNLRQIGGTMRNLLILSLLASYALLAACGQTGSLYLPCDPHSQHCLPKQDKKVEKYR